MVAQLIVRTNQGEMFFLSLLKTNKTGKWSQEKLKFLYIKWTFLRIDVAYIRSKKEIFIINKTE